MNSPVAADTHLHRIRGNVDRARKSDLIGLRYLRTALEQGVDIAVAREVEDGRGYVELVRRYTIAGTAEERRETVFVGLRRLGDRWAVVELRAGP